MQLLHRQCGNQWLNLTRRAHKAKPCCKHTWAREATFIKWASLLSETHRHCLCKSVLNPKPLSVLLAGMTWDAVLFFYLFFPPSLPYRSGFLYYLLSQIYADNPTKLHSDKIRHRQRSYDLLDMQHPPCSHLKDVFICISRDYSS